MKITENEDLRSLLVLLSILIGGTLVLGLSFYLMMFLIPIMIIAIFGFGIYLAYMHFAEKSGWPTNFNWPTNLRRNKQNEAIDVEFEIIEENREEESDKASD